MRLALALLFLAAQDSPEAALARKCDSQIPWITDGVELIDMELAAGHHPQYPEAREPKKYKVDRGALLAKARAKAAEERYQTAVGLEADLRLCLADWERHGRIDDFALGQRDAADRLFIPEKLYGREREIAG